MKNIQKLTSIIILLAIANTISVAASLSGKVLSAANEPLIGATIFLVESGEGTTTDSNGSYAFNNLTTKTYLVEVTYVGYQKITTSITISESSVKQDFIMEEDVSKLEDVVVVGKSLSQEISENPIQIASINVVKLQHESADVITVLDRSAGVRVRQSGGLGSQTSIQLNGLTGRAVRQYYDGIPLELLGGSVQLNNLPVNSIERIDVYKGVMPIDVGTDALAGGINVISRQVNYDYLDVSYQIGSFNTHVATLNASKNLGEHLSVSASGFYNYSDNNYKIRAKQRTPDFKEIEVEVERFHSAHQSSRANASIGVLKTRWADKLIYGVSYTQRYDEAQHGVRVGNKAVGEANIKRDAFIQDLRYSKSLFDDKFNIGYFGNYSISDETVRDSTINVYNWFGEVIATNRQGMELLSLPSQRTGRTKTQVHRLNLNYTLGLQHTLKVSSFLSDQNVKGEDPLAPKIGDVDPNTVPSFLTRSITGLSYESNWFDEKLETILFGKYYFYKQSTADFRSTNRINANIQEFAAQDNITGYGLGLKYSIKEAIYLRASYEQAVRIPTKTEVFGDFLTIEPNFFLRPEKSKNLNLSTFYRHNFTTQKYISLDVNWFLRDQSDLIRLEAGRNENDPAQYINEEEADARGVEITLKTAPLKDLELSANFTIQEVIKDGEVNATNTNGVGNPLPNIPSRFLNISGRYQFTSPFSKEDRISIYGYYTFVDEFDLIFQTTRNEENIIPLQSQLDFGLSYQMANNGFVLSLQANNVLNQEVFDNYRVPKPGRYFNFKIRYLFQKI